MKICSQFFMTNFNADKFYMVSKIKKYRIVHRQFDEFFAKYLLEKKDTFLYWQLNIYLVKEESDSESTIFGLNMTVKRCLFFMTHCTDVNFSKGKIFAPNYKFDNKNNF